MSRTEAERILAAQELAELKLKRLDTLKAISKYRAEHRLETFVPHARQQRVVEGALNPQIRTICMPWGNRGGKTAIAAAITASFALGRLPWVPIPKPLVLPDPYGVRVHATGEFSVIYPQATVATLPPSEQQGWTPHVVETDRSLRTNATRKSGLLTRMFPSDKAFKAWRSSLAAPTDPGALRFKPPLKIRIFGEDAKAMEQVQIPAIKECIPPEAIAAIKKNSFGLDGHWVLTNGSTLDFFTYQQEPASFEGWHGHLCWYDEPPPRQIWVANQRGLVDHTGLALFSMTPLKEAWIADEIVNKPDPKTLVVTASSYDNPHVPKGSLDDFFATLSPEELKTRRDGEFLHLQGLVFKDFKQDTHIVDPFIPDRSYTVYAAIDTHPRTEQAVLFAAVDRKENVFVFHEIFKHGTPEQVAGWIADFNRTVHPVELVLIDPSSQGDTNRGDSTYDLISQRLIAEGIPMDFGSKDLLGGIQIMQTFIKSRNGLASLFVTRDCERFLYEIFRYIWMDWKGTSAQSKHQMNKPVDVADHLLENCRRILQLPPRFVNPAHREALREQTTGFQAVDPTAGY